MKRSLFVIATGCVLVAGCNEKVELTPEVLGEGVYATLEQPDVLSTKSLDYADGKLSFSWANGDQLMVYGQSTSAILTVNEAEGGSANVTKLESPDFKLNDGATYYVFSPVAGTLSESTKDAVNVSFDNQRQVSNGSTAHLKSTQYACATATVKDNAVNFQLYNQVSWVRFSHKFTDGVTASKVVFTAEGAEDAFVHDGMLDTTSPVTEKGFATSITAVGDKSQYLDINLGEESSEGIDIASGDTLEVFVAVHPVDLTGKTLKVQVLDKSGKELSTNEYAGRAIKRNAFVSFTDNSAKPTDVASVNGVGYAQLYEALWACKNGETVKLLQDVEVGGLELYSENNAVLDLNGKNLITTGKSGISMNGGNLTIKGSGKVGDPSLANTDYLFDLGMSSTLTIEGDAEFYGKVCVYAGWKSGIKESYIYIKGGKWYGSDFDGIYYTINKQDDKKDDIHISVTGGEFYKFNPAAAPENPVENWVADGYGVVKDGDWYKVGTAEQISEIIATNTTNLETALGKGTATVSEDVTVDCVSVGKKSTLQLSDNATITVKGSTSSRSDGFMCGSSKVFTVKGEGSLVADMSKDATSTDVVFVNGGTVNIYDGVNIEAGSGNSANYAIRILKGTVNIYGGYFHTSNTGVCELIYLECAWRSTATLNISGGVFECDGDPKYMINCQDSYINNCKISITGGSFVGWNPADSEADKINGANANWVADGYVSTKTTYNGKDAWVVTKK